MSIQLSLPARQSRNLIKMATGSCPNRSGRCPAPLASVGNQYDKNQDGTLSSDEIAGGIAAWNQTGVGARQVPFTVQLDGRGLSGATVRLIPASFLGDGLKGASGQTAPVAVGCWTLHPKFGQKMLPTFLLCSLDCTQWKSPTHLAQ